MEEQLKQYKKQMIDELIQTVLKRGQEIHETNMPTEEQLAKVDVLLDVSKFLDHYEENVKVLNNYWLTRTHNNRFNTSSNHDESR